MEGGRSQHRNGRAREAETRVRRLCSGVEALSSNSNSNLTRPSLHFWAAQTGASSKSGSQAPPSPKTRPNQPAPATTPSSTTQRAPSPPIHNPKKDSYRRNPCQVTRIYGREEQSGCGIWSSLRGWGWRRCWSGSRSKRNWTRSREMERDPKSSFDESADPIGARKRKDAARAVEN